MPTTTEPSTASTTQNSPETSSEQASAPAPASDAQPKGGSFIQSALSALSKVDSSDKSTSDTPEPKASVKEVAPVASEKAAPEQPSDSASQPSSDEDDAKAEADIKRETANMSASHKAAFTKLRYEARDLKRQLKAAQAQKEAPTSQESSAPAVQNEEVDRLKSEYETLKTKLADYEKEAYTMRLESTELYQNEVARPRQQIAETVSDIAKRYPDIDEEAVISAVRTADAERVSRVTADMSEFDRFRFYKQVEEYHRINSREGDLRNNSKAELERIYREQRERDESKKSQEKGQWQKAISESWEQLTEDFPVLAPVDNDEDWNSKLEGVKNFASPERYESLTVRERAEALYRAAAFPVLVAELEAVMEDLKDTQTKLAKYDGATPSVSGDASGSVSDSESSASSGGSFVESALQALKKAGSR